MRNKVRGDGRRPTLGTRRASIKMVLLFIRETTGLPPHESACPVVARLPCGRHAPTGRESTPYGFTATVTVARYTHPRTDRPALQYREAPSARGRRDTAAHSFYGPPTLMAILSSERMVME